MKKIAGSGSISQRHGSPDPDPHQNVMDPEHCAKEEQTRFKYLLYFSFSFLENSALLAVWFWQVGGGEVLIHLRVSAYPPNTYHTQEYFFCVRESVPSYWPNIPSDLNLGLCWRNYRPHKKFPIALPSTHMEL